MPPTQRPACAHTYPDLWDRLLLLTRPHPSPDLPTLRIASSPEDEHRRFVSIDLLDIRNARLEAVLQIWSVRHEGTHFNAGPEIDMELSLQASRGCSGGYNQPATAELLVSKALQVLGNTP